VLWAEPRWGIKASRASSRRPFRVAAVICRGWLSAWSLPLSRRGVETLGNDVAHGARRRTGPGAINGLCQVLAQPMGCIKSIRNQRVASSPWAIKGLVKPMRNQRGTSSPYAIKALCQFICNQRAKSSPYAKPMRNRRAVSSPYAIDGLRQTMRNQRSASNGGAIKGLRQACDPVVVGPMSQPSEVVSGRV
jgi:hypothetical protein